MRRKEMIIERATHSRIATISVDARTERHEILNCCLAFLRVLRAFVVRIRNQFYPPSARRILLTQILTAFLLLIPAPAFLQTAADLPEQALSGGNFSNDDAGSTAYLHPVATLDAKQA